MGQNIPYPQNLISGSIVANSEHICRPFVATPQQSVLVAKWNTSLEVLRLLEGLNDVTFGRGLKQCGKHLASNRRKKGQAKPIVSLLGIFCSHVSVVISPLGRTPLLRMEEPGEVPSNLAADSGDSEVSQRERRNVHQWRGPARSSSKTPPPMVHFLLNSQAWLSGEEKLD